MEAIATINLTTKEYANLRGCSDRYIKRLCLDGRLECLPQSFKRRGGSGGISYLIPLASLPDKEIKRYLRKHKKEEVLRGGELVDEEEREQIIDINFERLSVEQRKELNFKNKILDSWISYRRQEYRAGKTYAEADDNFIRVISLQYPDMPLSLRSIHRWDKIRRTKGEGALVDRRGRHGHHQKKMSKDVFDIFEYYYLDESKKSASFCIELTKLDLKKRGMDTDLPSEKTFVRWANERIPVPVREYFRNGEKAFKDRCMPYIHRDYEDLHSNDIWVCDNHTFDIMVNKDRKPARVYLTAFLDVRSRKVVGHHVTLSPSADATLYALRTGIERYGIPKRVYSDNGREFLTFDVGGRGFRKKSKNADLDPETIMERLGIEFKTAMVKNAKAKIVERTFRTVKEEFSKLFLAYTGGNVLEKPERLKYIVKDIDNLVLLEDFDDMVKTYLYGEYNERRHSGEGMRGMTPNQVFNLHLVEQRKTTKEILNLMLLRSTRLQKVSRAGVKLSFYGKDVFFTNHELLYNYQGERVFVRYNPADLSEVRIYDSEDRYLMSVEQDRQVSYFASKDEIAVKMKTQRGYEKIVKAYKKDKGIKVSDGLSLMLERAGERMQIGEELDPAVIQIMQSPDREFNELCIKQAVGSEIDWSVANINIKKYEGSKTKKWSLGKG